MTVILLKYVISRAVSCQTFQEDLDYLGIPTEFVSDLGKVAFGSKFVITWHWHDLYSCLTCVSALAARNDCLQYDLFKAESYMKRFR